jgi:hypothetical protein
LGDKGAVQFDDVLVVTPVTFITWLWHTNRYNGISATTIQSGETKTRITNNLARMRDTSAE